MGLLYFEDFPAGMERRFGARVVPKSEIISFAREFDPQPFHLDEQAAAQSLLGGLAASGWHTLAVLMRLYCEEWVLRSASMGSPGIAEARWLKPVRLDDVLSVAMRVLDARISRSRPEMGLLTIASEILNQKGEAVASVRHVNMLGRRGHDWAKPIPNVSPTPGREPRQNLPPMNDEAAPARDWFEDVEIGRRAALGSYKFKEADMIRFARAWDPQPFHVDPDAAKRSPFGRLVASGWHTASAFMRCLVEQRDRVREFAIARGETAAPGGPSPGFRDLRWLAPVCAGDEVSYASTIVDKRMTAREGWGLVFAHNVGDNAEGRRVFEFTSAAFYPLRRGG